MSDKPFENAYWIWDDGDPSPINAHRYFRKSFVVPEHWPSNPVLRIAADTRYKLCVNNSWILAGPAASARGIATYDETRIYAKPGDKIVLVALVSHIGQPMFSYNPSRAGLIVEVEDVVTDASWLISRQSPFSQTTERLTPMISYSDSYDPSLEPHESNLFNEELLLMQPEQWSHAVVVQESYGPSWPRMMAFDVERLADPKVSHRRHTSGATSIISYGNCRRGEGSSAAERATNDVCLALSSGGITRSSVSNSVRVTSEGDDLQITYDFGQQVSGYVSLRCVIPPQESADFSNAYIDVAYGEILHLADSPSGFKAKDDSHSIHYADQLMLSARLPHFMSSEPRSFRYMRLIIRNARGVVIITTPSLEAPSGFDTEARRYDARQNLGSTIRVPAVFVCSDARLGNIFDIGQRTLRLCMDDQFMDTPMRERAQYIGDARVEAIGARYSFGDSTLHARFLRQVALSQHADGRLDPVGPGEWNVLEPNKPIPGYVAIYVLSVLDYFQLTGDGDLVREVMPAVLKALVWLGSYGGGEGGLLVNVPGWNFTDWAPGLDQGTDGINAAVNLFYLMALQAASRLAELGGDEAAARSHGLRANMIAAAFDSLFWNPMRGVYVDSVIGGEPSQLASQQVNSLALLADTGSEARRVSIAEHLLTDGTLTQTGTPYFGYYLTQALAAAGRETEALQYIRERWGAMFDAGATTWWKTWDGLQSRCHGWSIGPTIWLPQHVLGITAREPGFATVDFAPKLCGLTWAKGIVPIPQGDVQVSWLRKGSKLTIDVTVPTGVLLRPILPCPPTDIILIDGQSAREDQIVRRTPHSAEIAVLPGTGYRFEVTVQVNV